MPPVQSFTGSIKSQKGAGTLVLLSERVVLRLDGMLYLHVVSSGLLQFNVVYVLRVQRFSILSFTK